MTRSGLRKVILVGGACEHFPVELSVLPAKLCDYPNRGYWIDRLVPARHLIVFGVPTPAVHMQTGPSYILVYTPTTHRTEDLME